MAFASVRRLAGVAFLCLAFAASSALAASAPQPDRTADMAKVLQPGPLPELAMGDPSGVPVIEYGSLTCPHCAVFSKETFPELKKDYIDTGKVRFIFREFARNPLDVAAFVLARCVGDDNAFAADEVLFAAQDKWAFVMKPLEPLIAAMRPTGLKTHDQAITCLKDQSKADAIVAITKRANDAVHVTGTPTFVIDGKVYGGELTLDQLKAILDPLVKTSRPPVTAQLPTPRVEPPVTSPPEDEPHSASSGTGIFVTNDGYLITNAHVVKNCTEIRVNSVGGNQELGKLVAKDQANDLALLRLNSKPSGVGALRFGVRLGENVEVFGFPLSQVLATSGNFTSGTVTALSGLGDDSRYVQVSAPIQPGNSGGPLLDESGNVVGIVTATLNPFTQIKSQGNIPQNVNFALKATIAANFLQDNNIKFQIGEATQPAKGPILADQARAISAYIECR